MSADNMICIQRRNDGRWWVWMDTATARMEGTSTKPCSHDVNYLTRREAVAYAFGWLRGEYVVEYGVREILEPELTTVESYSMRADGATQEVQLDRTGKDRVFGGCGADSDHYDG